MNTSNAAHAPSRCFAVASGKGGTGKSIITATLAALLVECGFKVLLIDTDLFTSGLSFYLLEAKSRQSRLGLQDVFIRDAFWDKLTPIPTLHPGISIIPSVSRNRIDTSELRVSPALDFKKLVDQLRLLRDRWGLEYDYVIFDSRGGTDHTSVAACVAAGAYVIVTEADKTSWDLGDNLIENIERATDVDTTAAVALGFILNKNVLPAEAIEAFLRRRWAMPHLATIPMDEEAIRAFQNDAIPTEVTRDSRFVASITFVVYRALVDEEWSATAHGKLDDLLNSAERIGSRSGQLSSLVERRDFILRIYGLTMVLAIFLAAMYFKSFAAIDSVRNSAGYVALGFVTVMYVFSLFVDRQFTTRLARFIVRRLDRVRNEDSDGAR